MISFMLCHASRASLIDLRSLSIHIINKHQINEETRLILININRTISAKGFFRALPSNNLPFVLKAIAFISNIVGGDM